MSSPYLEQAAMAEEEAYQMRCQRDDARQELDVTRKRHDHMKSELTKAIQEIQDLREECQRLHDLAEEI